MVKSLYAFSQADADQVYKELQEIPLYVPEKYSQPKAKALGYGNIFSPQSFDEYVGQSESSYLAQIMVQAARNESRALPSILVVGEYGLGKTSLARLIISAYGTPLRLYDASSINKEIPESGTIVIDEIHNLTSEVADTLNMHLDSGNLVIIGCTTNSGALPSAFRSRFRTLFLEDYSFEEVALILNKICKRKGTVCNKDAIDYIAKRARFNARHGIMLLQTIFDFMAVKNQKTLTEGVAIDTLDRLGIDERGFLPRDRKYLNSLPSDRPVGLTYLSAMLGIDEKTIEQEVEPFLLRVGFIDRQPRGRIKLQGF